LRLTDISMRGRGQWTGRDQLERGHSFVLLGWPHTGSPCRRAAGPRTPLASVPPMSGSPAAIPAPTPVRRSISLDLSPRRGGRVVECTGLENQQAGEPRLEGSNPSPSVFEPRTASIWPLQTLNQPRHFRAVFAPVRPRAQRSQAVSGGRAAPATTPDAGPGIAQPRRIWLNQAKKNGWPSKMPFWVSGIFKTAAFNHSATPPGVLQRKC
jgi:hypothetical protein